MIEQLKEHGRSYQGYMGASMCSRLSVFQEFIANGESEYFLPMDEVSKSGEYDYYDLSWAPVR